MPRLHRPASRPRSDVAASVRGHARGGPYGPAARSDAGDGRSQPADHGEDRRARRASADRRCGWRCATEGAGGERRRVRRPLHPRHRRCAGHRPCRRTRAGLHASRHHHRLRRQPHRRARRAGGARVRHRDERGRACAGDADSPAPAVADDGSARRGKPRVRRQPQGRHPHHRRPDRRGGRYGARHRISWKHLSRHEHRGSADRRQYVDRGGRAIGPVRTRREDL